MTDTLNCAVCRMALMVLLISGSLMAEATSLLQPAASPRKGAFYRTAHQHPDALRLLAKFGLRYCTYDQRRQVRPRRPLSHRSMCHGFS